MECIVYSQQPPKDADPYAGLSHATTARRTTVSRTLMYPPNRTPITSEHAPATRLDSATPFPPGYLVFVTNVHPEMSKTTLKAPFSAHAAVAPDSVHGHRLHEVMACPVPPLLPVPFRPPMLDVHAHPTSHMQCHLRLPAPAPAHALAS